MKSNFLSTTHPAYKQVNKVVVKILKSNAELPAIKTKNWKVTVIDNPKQNAFVVPVSFERVRRLRKNMPWRISVSDRYILPDRTHFCVHGYSEHPHQWRRLGSGAWTWACPHNPWSCGKYRNICELLAAGYFHICLTSDMTALITMSPQ